jgi:rhodanese-related sulfurtransferase
MNRIVGIILLAALLLFAGCAQKEAGTQVQVTQAPQVVKVEYRGITPQELKAMLDSGEDIFLLDVHIPEQTHIRGTDAFIPYNQIKRYADRLPKDKSTKIVVYCKAGPMSFPAIKALYELGYTNVYYLKGGIVAWQRAGYPVP